MNVPDLSEGRVLVEAMTPGVWGAYWHDAKEDPDAIAAALRLSREADRNGDWAATSFRVTTDQSDPDWLNLAFVGNGPCSGPNAQGIVWLRNNADALLAEAARARTLEAALRDLLNMTRLDDRRTTEIERRARALLDIQEGP